MKFAPPEIAPSAEKADVQLALSKLGDRAAVIENRMKGDTSVDDLAEIMEEMEAIKRETAPLQAQLRQVEALQQLGLEGADSTLRAQARELIVRKEKNQKAIEGIKKQIEKVSADLKEAEEGITMAATAEATLKAIAKVESIGPQIALLKADVRRMESEDASFASELEAMQKNELLKPFTMEKRAA